MAGWEESFHRARDGALRDIRTLRDLDGVEAFRIKYLGRKDGLLTDLLRRLKDLPLEERRRWGPEANGLRAEIEGSLEARKRDLEAEAELARAVGPSLDLTLPARPYPRGRLHPLTLTLERMTSILSRLGFSWAEGPLVEDDWHNFEALNIPPEHPARDLQDTYYLQGKAGRTPLLMRTHTSPVQIRALKASTPPVRVMAPGRVFRHEAVDATHSHVFHQVEGLYVDRRVTMADLKGTLSAFMKELFGPSTRIRFRPSYFPFVEPGAEVDVSCLICGGKAQGCPVCKGTGFLEMLGAGLVHPRVLEAGGHDPAAWTGYAFGIGVERIAMMLFAVPDIRAFYENDLRLLSQVG